MTFTAATDPDGMDLELWRSDGTAKGFTAEDGTGVRRLWALPLRPEGRCPARHR